MRTHPLFLFCSFMLALVATSAARAQHATAFDIVDGKQAFQLYCASCHGPNGDLIAQVDLGHGNFRQPYTDAQLTSIIMTGIPNTPMPATPGMNTEQAGKIVAYLRSLAQENTDNLIGDSASGQTLFEGRGECMSCHSINGTGSRLGPELSRIGLLRSAAELEVALRAPEREVQPNHRFYEVTTTSGEQVRGRLLNQDIFTVQLLDSNEQLRSFDKTRLQNHRFVAPDMPALTDDYSDQDIADLVAYLSNLRGPTQ